MDHVSASLEYRFAHLGSHGNTFDCHQALVGISYHSELMRWMPPFPGHHKMLDGAMAAPEGGAYGERTHAVDRPGEAQLPSLRD
jgi:hypothetical protein